MTMMIDLPGDGVIQLDEAGPNGRPDMAWRRSALLKSFVLYMEQLPPERFSMDYNRARAVGRLIGRTIPQEPRTCLVTTNLAGHVLLRFPQQALYASRQPNCGKSNETIAAKVLGLDMATAFDLFFGQGYRGALSDITKAEAVIVLKVLAETGRVSWDFDI